MENKDKTYVDDAVDALLGIEKQIGFIIDVMGGYKAQLNPERDNFRSFLDNIANQIVQQIVFLSSGQRGEYEEQDPGNQTEGQPTMRTEK